MMEEYRTLDMASRFVFPIYKILKRSLIDYDLLRSILSFIGKTYIRVLNIRMHTSELLNLSYSGKFAHSESLYKLKKLKDVYTLHVYTQLYTFDKKVEMTTDISIIL